MSYMCYRRCDEDCLCVVNGVHCNPMCKLQDCSNIKEDDEVEQYMDDSDTVIVTLSEQV